VKNTTEYGKNMVSLGKEQYRVEVSYRFAALEDLDTEAEINSAWETLERI
jgi:hypothetical protein